MNERMNVRVEVWPVAADELDIWLVSPEHDAWRSEPIPADSDPHRAVETVLCEHGEDRSEWLRHSTSWRVDGDSVILTYVVVLGSHGHAGLRLGTGAAGLNGEYTYVRDIDAWAHAMPLTLEVAELVGKPPAHGATEAPAARDIDVLMHAIRHLRFLLDTDTHVQAALDEDWRMHLNGLQPALSGMYQHALGA